MRAICLSLGLILVFSLSHAQEGNILQSLVEIGFENVDSFEREGDLYVTYENNVYRFEGKAIAAIISEFSKLNLSHYESIHFLLRSQDIPMALVTLSTFDLSAYKTGSISTFTLATNMQFSIDVDKVETYFNESERFNKSFYKIDIPVGLSLDYALGDFNDGFMARTYVVPRILSSFGRGSEFEFEYTSIIQNDFPESAISSPTVLKITQNERLGKNAFLSTSLGYLPQGKFGLHTRFRNYLAQERFYIELFFGITRRGYLDNNWKVINNRNSDAVWQGIFNYRWNKFDTDFNLTYGTFYSGDLGYKFQITRQFNEVYFNLFYGRTDIVSTGSFGTTEKGIIGFSLTVPFGQSKFLKPTRIRSRTDDQFDLLYRYSGFSFSTIDILSGSTLFSDIREFYPEVLRKGLIKHLYLYSIK
jgi:hypothetical protein